MRTFALKSAFILLAGLTASLASFAAEEQKPAKENNEAAILADNRRGEKFEHNGVIYTISSIYNMVEAGHWEVKYDSTLGTATAKREGINGLYCNRYGEVIVSGVSAQHVDVVINPKFVTKTNYDSNKEEPIIFTVIGIEDNAFEKTSLRNLILPTGMKHVGKEAFKEMEITSEQGTFFFPLQKRVLADAFDGLKARLFLTFEFYKEDCHYDKTFRNTDLLPEIYVHHNNSGHAVEGLDRKLLYSVGSEYQEKWTPDVDKKSDIKTTDVTKYQRGAVSYLGDKVRFKTLGENTVSPTFNIRKARKFNKTNTCLDIFAPYEYSCYNPYTSQQDVYSEFVMNNNMYRVKKGKEYLYFTLDGKPITDKKSLTDRNGKDPFGTQILNDDEMKAKKNTQNLNNSVNNLRNQLGF
ncbi:MAG: hypothetical protein MJZ19_09665 [Paludibacteraceae bacterium]|nr:hypothetical protein [Paludibacteraceae bacterium]